MQQKLVWRYRAPGPLELVVELSQMGEELTYRRLFEGEVVLEKRVSKEQADRARDVLVTGGWRQE